MATTATTYPITNNLSAADNFAEWTLANPDIAPIEGWQCLRDDIDGKHSFLIEYYKRCRSGEITIGRELKTTLESLIQDIFYRSDVYRFTLDAAHKRINFIEKEVKHFESPFAGKPFILTLCQKAIAEAIFGFYIFDTELLGGGRWVRRFKEVLLLIARKNGKTPFTAALTLAEWFCGEAGQKVMCASNDYDQAGLIFDCINAFREESHAVSRVTRKNIKGIFFGNPKQRKMTGKFSAQNKGAIKKMSAKSGAKEGRNLKIVIVDEVHEMKDGSTIMPLRSSLTTQDEPLFFEITTEGSGVVKIINIVVGVVEDAVNFVIGIINKLIDGVNSSLGWLGVHIDRIAEVKLRIDTSEIKDMDDVNAIIDSTAPTQPKDNGGNGGTVYDNGNGTGTSGDIYNYDNSTKNTTQNITVTIQNYAAEVDTDKLVREINMKLAEAM